jgi:uncharacterized membrane protein
MDGTTLLPLIGIPIVVIGFALRFNPLLVVVVAGLATGLLVGMDFGMLLEPLARSSSIADRSRPSF